MRKKTRNKRVGGAVAVLLLSCASCVFPVSASARTIELGVSDLDGFAAISPLAPKLGFVGYSYGASFHTFSQIYLDAQRSVLARYPLSRIGPGMKITNAQWVLPMDSANTPEVKVHVWRVLSPWGLGVCYLHRATEPEVLSWRQPGARGAGVDRAGEPTAIVSVGQRERELVVNVTQDAALWYSGAAPNHGWIITVEQVNASVTLRSPTWTGLEEWKLRITYEPQ